MADEIRSQFLYIPGSNWEAEKSKILKDAKADAIRGMPKTASVESTYIKDQDPYPSPYLNLSDYQIPRTMVEVFKWCRYFYKFDSLIGGAVNALSRFPVTDVILEDMEALPEGWDTKEDSPTLALYKQTFKDLKVEDELIRIGIDYFLYGNCFIFGEFEDFSTTSTEPDLRWTRIFRLDPGRITIDIDPLTQEKTYKWEVPPKIKKVVREKKPKEKYESIPEVIKQAVKENKTVVLNSKNVYHFSREGESGDGSVWGTPIILNVMKQIAYRNLLRQAQEAIAREHVVPFRVFYLDPNEKMDPQANWSNVSYEFGRQLEQAAKDPNYKVVSPVPVNVLNLGGQGRALMLTAEIEQLQNEILAGMGVPREFIFGGVSYSAASISLRILENQFITYRLILTDFLNNFLVKRMAEVRGEWNSALDDPYLVTAKMADLKMQDDIQQKQLIINLNAANKVSDEYMYNMLSIDPDKMKAQIEIEIFEKMERERRMQVYQTETDFVLQQKQMETQALLQQAFGVPMMMQQMAAQQQMAPPEEAGPNGQKKSTSGSSGSSSSSGKSSSKSSSASSSKSSSSSSSKSKPKSSGQTKKASVDMYLTPGEELCLDAIIKKLAALNKDSRRDLIQKLSTETRDKLMCRIEKLGASGNPNSVGMSGSRNIALSKMTELEKVQALKSETEQAANATNEYNADLAMMPMPEQKPPRRSNLV